MVIEKRFIFIHLSIPFRILPMSKRILMIPDLSLSIPFRILPVILPEM